jgi:hypothetical protein
LIESGRRALFATQIVKKIFACEDVGAARNDDDKS